MCYYNLPETMNLFFAPITSTLTTLVFCLSLLFKWVFFTMIKKCNCCCYIENMVFENIIVKYSSYFYNRNFYNIITNRSFTQNSSVACRTCTRVVSVFWLINTFGSISTLMTHTKVRCHLASVT